MKKVWMHALLLASMLLPQVGPFALATAYAAPLSSRLSSFLGSNDDVLPPDEAFQLKLRVIDRHTLSADFTVAPGHYLYRDRMRFETTAADSTPANVIRAVNLPPGDLKEDPTFGKTEVYHQDVSARLQLGTEGTGTRNILVQATYQGCSEKGLCYAPIHKTLTVSLPSAADAPSSSGDSAAAANLAAGVYPSQPSDKIASLLQGKQLWLVAAGFFGFGLLLSLTPCMLPMIPILSGIIVGGQSRGKLHTFNLSLVYVLGMALSYTAAGIAAGLSGKLLSSTLQSPWVLAITALLFVVLALSMFGFFEIRLPSAAENRLSATSRRLKGGRYIGVLFMGSISALIVSPCVAAPLAGALLYISQTRDVILGGTALFALSIGMGMPLLLIGASAGSLLPKAGPWMDRVRQLFGVLMLGIALWVASPLLPASLQLAAWAALLIAPAIFMHALDRLPPDASAASKLWKGVGVMLLVVGICQLVGAFSGAASPLRPLAVFTGSGSANGPALPFKRIASSADLDRELLAARAAGKPVMLDFYADWCVSCKELDQFTFRDTKVRDALQQAVLLQADVTANNTEDSALLARFQLFGPPAILLFPAHPQRPPIRLVGYQNAEQLLAAYQNTAGQGCDNTAYC